jgi:hypothetical protein
MATFREALSQQKWDDHRFYHHNLINQSLHFFSASTFLVCYALLFKDPGIASFLAWTLAMLSRQSGHFYFEPKGFDEVNDATHEHKEEIKVGYNLFRKWILMSVWALSPLLLVWQPTLFGMVHVHRNWIELIRHVGYIWLAVGVGGLLFRVIQLCIVRDVQTGIVWGAKILTDPFTDFKLYCKAPVRILRGQRIDHDLDSTEDECQEDGAAAT